MVTYHDGDLLESKCEVICHQTNCKGVMGSGIAKVIRLFYPEAYQALECRFAQGEAELGEIDVVPTVRDGFMRCVVNCYGE
jgi:O-acetyl-ADP-ribose deacetylase (regulator of RNase III)